MSFNNMSTAELLRECKNRKGYSPLIDELAERLNNLIYPIPAEFGQCPVCDSKLKIAYDAGNEIYNIKQEPI